MLEGLKGVYPADDVFRAAFSEKSIGTTQARNRRIVRYILCALEHQKSGVELDFENDTITLEHICSINPNGGWPTFSDEEVEALTSRIGNMALLKSKQNKDLGNADYETKRPVYAGSSFMITREVAEHNADWTPSRLAARQRSLASIATSIWRVPRSCPMPWCRIG